MSIRELEHDINITRDELEATLTALQAKLSPRQRLKARWHSVRDQSLIALQNTVEATRKGVLRAKQEPRIVLGVAFAVGLILGLGTAARRRRWR